MVLLCWSKRSSTFHGYVNFMIYLIKSISETDSVGLISLCHEHKEFDGQRIDKKYRIPVRFSVAVVLICLPLADSLNSLQLIAVTTSLVVFTLSIDVYGGTSIHENFWRSNRQCKYRANCPLKRKLLLEAVKNGTTIKLDEVQGDRTERENFYA